MSRTLEEWLDFIYSLHTSRIDLGLQRIVDIAKEQNLLHFPCPVVTVAGTNGKGSCIRILESIYSAAGYRVGAYSSPHLIRFNERVRFQEQDVDDATLIAAFENIESFRRSRPLSFFEFTTLAALWILKSAEPDVMLLEIGLGGRLDAVNVVESDVAIVTSIGFDHMDWLGDNLDQIALEKAGVYRQGKPAICGESHPPEALLEQAAKLGATLFMMDRDYSYEIHSDSWSWQGQKIRYPALPMPHLKCQNAATSLMSIECLMNSLPVNEAAVVKGLLNARLPGRFQQISSPIKAILDVAHNPDSARWLAEQMKVLSLPAKKVAVIGMLKNKDIAGTIDPMLPHIDVWCVAGLSVERAADPQEILNYLKASGVKSCYNFCAVSQALRQARAECTHPDDRVIAFGSFYTVADVQKALREEVEI